MLFLEPSDDVPQMARKISRRLEADGWPPCTLQTGPDIKESERRYLGHLVVIIYHDVMCSYSLSFPFKNYVYIYIYFILLGLRPTGTKLVCFSLHLEVPMKVELYFFRKDVQQGIITGDMGRNFPLQAWGGRLPLEIIYPFSSCRLGSAWEMQWMNSLTGSLEGPGSWTHDILQVGWLWMLLKARIMFLSWYWYVLMAWPLSLFFPFSPSPVVLFDGVECLKSLKSNAARLEWSEEPWGRHSTIGEI